MQDAPVMTKGTFDSLNLAFWDVTSQSYLAYSRYFDQGNYNGVRSIHSSRSQDFVHWADPTPNQYGENAPREHFYTNATWPCPGAPHQLLAFPMRFMPNRKKIDQVDEAGVSDSVFMTSRNGQLWDRTFREAWVRPGLDERNWTHRNNMPAWGVVQTTPDEFSMYVSEHYMWPDNRLRRITIRRHGFASVHAGSDEGEFTTRPLIFSGEELTLNYATSAAGSVQVEIQDERGQPIPGYTLDEMEPLFGDELDAVVKWKSGENLSNLPGRPVRFRFKLRDADLFALRTEIVGEENRVATGTTAIDLSAQLNAAQENLRAGDLDTALERLEPLLTTDALDQPSKQRVRELAARVLHLRGEQHFTHARIAEAVADFDRQVQLLPDRAAEHWQRGIAYYYAKDYERGARQFELHQTVNPQDVENAAWHFLCMVRTPEGSVEAAQKKLFPVTGDSRVPMSQIQQMFGGVLSPEDVLRAGEEAGGAARFYADLYVGLYYEALGRNDESLRLLSRAADDPAARKNYMGDVARVPVILRKMGALAPQSPNP
jgi:tetratricopeptide (TPR) repeat protein